MPLPLRFFSWPLAFVLASCQTVGGPADSKGAGAQATATSVARAQVSTTVHPDIIAGGTNVSLGSGWYPYETHAGVGFRWVDNDAKIIVRRPATPLERLVIDAEPGPGFGLHAARFNLFIATENGSAVAKSPVLGRQSVRFDLPVKPEKDATFALHVSGGGKRIPNESRILNFRVFRIASAPPDGPLGAGHPDITTDPNLRLGSKWYPLEQYQGETFRWVDNDAQLIVSADRAKEERLKLVAAAGPSILSPGNFTISLRGADGTELQAGKIKARGILYLNLPLREGSNTFMLHADSTGKRAPNDPRILNFRVFSLSIQ